MSDGLKMKYFVLKPEGTDDYARASRAAMMTYADFIVTKNPELTEELRAWAGREFINALETGEKEREAARQ
jgi:hypothetical protein